MKRIKTAKKKISLLSAAVLCLCYNAAASGAAIQTGVTYNIVNRWQNTYLHDGGNNALYGPLSNNAAYRWTLEASVGGSYEIRNIGTGEYLNIESNNGQVQATTRNPSWDSAKWLIEPTADGYVRLRNRWHSTHFVNNEHSTGTAEIGTIHDSWASAQWQLVVVGTPTPTPTPTPTVAYTFVNRWQGGTLLDGGVNATYAAQSNGAISQWILVPSDGGAYLIRNVATGEYLNIEANNGMVQSTPTGAGWESAKWNVESTGDGYVRLRNRWQNTQFV
ncbi:MAG: RICIN domain-containing protein, partial [Pseudomonadota bacterium]